MAGRARFDELRRIRAARAAQSQPGDEGLPAAQEEALTNSVDYSEAVEDADAEEVEEEEDCVLTTEGDGESDKEETAVEDSDCSDASTAQWELSDQEEEVARLRESLAQHKVAETALLLKLQTKRRRVAAAEKSVELLRTQVKLPRCPHLSKHQMALWLESSVTYCTMLWMTAPQTTVLPTVRVY